MMTNLVDGVFKNTLMVSALLLAISTSFFLIGMGEGVAVLIGTLLGAVFVVSSAWVVETYQNAENSLFMKIYFISVGVRFLVILALFGILIGMTKIDEIYFTVSFLISYLCQSVTEMIFLNKII